MAGIKNDAPEPFKTLFPGNSIRRTIWQFLVFSFPFLMCLYCLMLFFCAIYYLISIIRIALALLYGIRALSFFSVAETKFPRDPPFLSKTGGLVFLVSYRIKLTATLDFIRDLRFFEEKAEIILNVSFLYLSLLILTKSSLREVRPGQPNKIKTDYCPKSPRSLVC